MSTIAGVIGAQHPDAEALGFRQIQPGRFVFRQVDSSKPLPRYLIRNIPTAHECPYCHAPLCRLDPKQGRYVGRAIQMVGSAELIFEPVPDGVLPLKCVPCDVHFSVLEANR